MEIEDEEEEKDEDPGVDEDDAFADNQSSSEIEPTPANHSSSTVEAEIAARVSDFNKCPDLSPENFMTNNQLYFLSNLHRNEGLMEYYHHLQEGLCSLFIQSKISDGKYKISAGNKMSSAL